MRPPLLPIAALLLPLLYGCTAAAEEVLPLAASVRAGSHVEAVQIVLRRDTAASVAALDDRARRQSAASGGDAARPFAEMLAATIRRAAREHQLVSGAPLRLVVEVDELTAAGTAAAAFGQSDRLAGTVFVRDATSDAPLGQLYVDVTNRNGGLIGLVVRGGGVREALAEEFADRVARALGGRSPGD